MELLSGLSTLNVSDTLTVNKLKANNSIGSNGQILASNGTSIYWTEPSAGLIPGSNTNITYNDSGSANGSNAFTFDKSTNTVFIANSLGIGNTAPTHELRVEGDISFSGGIHANGSIGSDGQILVSNGTVSYWAENEGTAYYKGNQGSIGIPAFANNLMRINSNTVSNTITISAGENALMVGPITVEGNNVLIIETGGRVVIA